MNKLGKIINKNTINQLREFVIFLKINILKALKSSTMA
jgi:hypothetical protein